MTHRATRRTMALLTVAASIGIGATASGAAAAEPAGRGLLGGLIGNLPTVPVVSPILEPVLTPILEAETVAQLDAALEQLTPAQLTAVTVLLNEAAAGGAATSPEAVTALVGQLTGLLGGGLPTDPAQLATLLSLVDGLTGLLDTEGVDPAALTELLGVVTGLLGGDPASPLAPLASVLSGVLGVSVPKPGGPGVPVIRPTLPGTGTGTGTSGAAGLLPYRAALRSVKVGATRKAATFRLACPAGRGCLVKLSGAAGGRSAFPATWDFLAPGTTKTVRVPLSKAATKRLAAKGGKVRLTARTEGSRFGAVTKSVRVKKATRR